MPGHGPKMIVDRCGSDNVAECSGPPGSPGTAAIRCCYGAFPYGNCYGSICWDGADPPGDGEGIYKDPVHSSTPYSTRMVTFNEAKTECQAQGKRLCKKQELLSGMCCDGGCGFDNDRVWVSDLSLIHI